MSIKPKYVSRIISGEKKFEFRKSIFKRDVEKVYIYSSSPQKQIVGYFKIKNILHSHPKQLWDETKEFSGINKKEFDEYYENKDLGYAIEIEEFIELKNYLSPYEYYNNFNAPQSFFYFNQCIIDSKEQNG